MITLDMAFATFALTFIITPIVWKPAMPKRFCLDCRQLTTNGSRCETCQGALDARMNARPKPNTTARGLGWRHQKRARELLATPGLACVRCGEPARPGDPLTAGHSVDRSKGGGESPLQPEHRSCGSRAGAELRRGQKRHDT